MPKNLIDYPGQIPGFRDPRERRHRNFDDRSGYPPIESIESPFIKIYLSPKQQLTIDYRRSRRLGWHGLTRHPFEGDRL